MPDDDSDRVLSFTTAKPLYQLAANATQLEVYDQLSTRLSHLGAMLAMVTGDGHDTLAR